MLPASYETLNYLMKEFRSSGISHEPGNGLEKVLLWQDTIVRMTMDEIKEFWNLLDKASRERFCYVNLSCLCYEVAIDILHHTQITAFKIQEKEKLERKYLLQRAELSEREEKCKKIERKLDALKVLFSD